MTVNEVSTTNRTDGFGRTAEPGRTFLVLNVTIENVSRDETSYSPLFFRVRSGTGEEFTSLFAEAPEPGLASGTLARGERVRGNVAFEITEGATGLMALYEPLVLNGETIRVNLGR